MQVCYVIFIFYRFSRTSWLNPRIDHIYSILIEFVHVVIIKLKIWLKCTEECDSKSLMTMCHAQPARYKGPIMDQRAPSSGQFCNVRSADVAQQQCGSDCLCSPPTGQKRLVQKPNGLSFVLIVIYILCKASQNVAAKVWLVYSSHFWINFWMDKGCTLNGHSQNRWRYI